jgi:hypothetical protein
MNDRALREQIEDAEGKLKASRRRLVELRETFAARTTQLEAERRTLEARRDELKARLAAVKVEVQKANEDLGVAWQENPVAPVSADYTGQGELTVFDGLLNAAFGQTPDWAEGQPFFRRLMIRFYQGMGARPRGGGDE